MKETVQHGVLAQIKKFFKKPAMSPTENLFFNVTSLFPPKYVAVFGVKVHSREK